MNRFIPQIVFIVFLSLFPAVAGNSLCACNYPFADTSSVNPQQTEKDYFNSFREKEEFVYIFDVRQMRQKSFWFRFGSLLKKLFLDLGNLLDALPVIIRIMMWGLVVFLIVILITKTRLNRVFYSNKAISDPEFELKDLNENITDFDIAIKNEVSQKNFRNAIRLLYLKLINMLDKRELIKYSKEKTNIDYLKELSSSQFQSAFLGLTGIYNNVWYGEHEIDMKQYSHYEQDFIHITSQIDEE